MSQTTIMGVRRLSAQVFDTGEGRGSALITIYRTYTTRAEEREEETISLHGPYAIVTEYANAINSCNDREAASQAVARQRDYLPELTQTLGEY